MTKQFKHNRTMNAIVISLAGHLVLLGIFAFVRFSKGSINEGIKEIPKACVKRVQDVIETKPIIPKPKIKHNFTDFSKNQKRIVRKNLTQKSSISRNINLPEELNKPGIFENNMSEMNAVEFFGNRGNGRKVCYVVDCSGSMLGLFKPVRNKLIDSIGKLCPENYFYVIMFRGAGLIESRCGELVRATPASVNEAIEEIKKSPRPYGKPNAMEALRRAFEITDPRGSKPDVVYFLTDGFDFSSDENQDFANRVENMRKQLAPVTKIHTIGFWANSRDRAMLESMAKKSQGEFVYFVSKEIN